MYSKWPSANSPTCLEVCSRLAAGDRCRRGSRSGPQVELDLLTREGGDERQHRSVARLDHPSCPLLLGLKPISSSLLYTAMSDKDQLIAMGFEAARVDCESGVWPRSYARGPPPGWQLPLSQELDG